VFKESGAYFPQRYQTTVKMPIATEILDEMPKHCSRSDYELGNLIGKNFISKHRAALMFV